MTLLLIPALFIAFLLLRKIQSSAETQQTTSALLQGAPTPGPNDFAGAQQAVQIDANTGRVIGTSVAAGAGAAGAAVAGSATFLTLTAAAWTGIGAAVAGIIVLVYTLRSDTHLYANELVQKYENPFGQYVTNLIAKETQLLNQNVLTRSDAQALYDAVNISWINYQATMQMLIARGGDWLIVAKQSLNNLDNRYQGETLPNGKVLGLGQGGLYPDGFMTTWLRWMQARIADLS